MRRRLHLVDASPPSRGGPTFLAFLRSIGVTLEPGQRVFWSVAADGVEPRELAGDDRDIAARIFGADVEVIPSKARKVIAVVKGADSGFTYVLALRMVHRALFADVSGAAPGEKRRCIVQAPDLALAREALAYASGVLEDCPQLARTTRTVGDLILITRLDGREVGIQVRAAAVGGRGGRGARWIEAALDEAAFFRDAQTGVVNDTDCYKAVAARVRGGQIWIGSTPWAESGLLFDLFRANWNAPKTALAAKVPTELMRTDPEVLGNVARERARDPENARREFDAEFLGSAESLLAGVDIDAAIDTGVEEREPTGGMCAMAIDLGTRHDRTAIGIAHLERLSRPKGPPDDVLVVDVLRTMTPKPGERVDLDEVEREVWELWKRFGKPKVMHDIYLADALAPRLRARGIECVEASMAPAAQARRGTSLAGKFRARTIRLVDNAIMRRELKEVRLTRHSGGRLSIAAPNRKGAHDDCVDVLMLLCDGVVGLVPGGNITVSYRVRFAREPLDIDVEERWFDRRTGLPAEPPEGTLAADRARAERNAQGMYTASDLESGVEIPGFNVPITQ